jgi:molybdopterin biosynthesis enzyme MoaB
VVRGKTSIVSRPGNPRAIAGCLRALLPAVVEAIDRSAGFRQKTKP